MRAIDIKLRWVGAATALGILGILAMLFAGDRALAGARVVPDMPGVPMLTATPTPTACTLSYGISQSAGAVLDPGQALVPRSQCDDCESTINLPFPYTLYDSAFTTASLSSNGLVAFVGTDRTFVNDCLPDTLVSYAIFPLWNDLTTDNNSAACDAYPGGNCGIYTSVTGVAPNRVFNIEWRAISFDHPTPVNLELRLFESQARFELRYASLDLTPGHADSATVAAQRDAGSTLDIYQCPGAPGAITPGTQLTFALNNSCSTATPTVTPTTPTAISTSTITPPSTPTPTLTPTFVPTNTPTRTPTPITVLVGHVTWQGPPAQPSMQQQLPLTLTLCVGGSPLTYVGTTDSSGFITVTTSLPSGSYNWWTKGSKYLATSGTAILAGGGTTQVEMGLQRAGDLDPSHDNLDNASDFNTLKAVFGSVSALGDLDNDGLTNASDFNLLKANFGQSGAIANCP